ncbi:hypothetical protein AVEN_129598-1 [Araneus ventricosus]|uniref:Uncharacterized protein n=1 Tax=Araneus ventricosus TaxID=182803 RepID=A0A4Y2TJU6_ARAVE|nr:hypothetical protein AVEN_129598-1 [Araneus ventricosus]
MEDKGQMPLKSIILHKSACHHSTVILQHISGHHDKTLRSNPIVGVVSSLRSDLRRRPQDIQLSMSNSLARDRRRCMFGTMSKIHCAHRNLRQRIKSVCESE